MVKVSDNREGSVNFLDTNGMWKDGKPVTRLVDWQDEVREVNAVMTYNMSDWDGCDHGRITHTKCHQCKAPIGDDDLVIHTDGGWVLVCRQCKMFVWFDSKRMVLGGGNE